MRTSLEHLDRFRAKHGGFGSPLGATYGAFCLPSPIGNRVLMVIASDGSETGWDHVSIHARSSPHSDRRLLPTWIEMEWVKRQFWNPEETVIQLHVPEDQHISIHDQVLHLWRPLNTPIPLPPAVLV